MVHLQLISNTNQITYAAERYNNNITHNNMTSTNYNEYHFIITNKMIATHSVQIVKFNSRYPIWSL